MIILTTSAKKANAITHGGTFHSDDVIATVILEKLLGTLYLYRTFSPADLKDIDDNVIVFDFGFGKYDHHQKGGNGVRDNGIPYASAGLLWRDFGHKILKNTPDPDFIWEFIDSRLIQGIDAKDNGSLPGFIYPTQPMLFSEAILGFNPTWDKTDSANEQFFKAVVFAQTVFDNLIETASAEAKAKLLVEGALTNTDGNILILDKFIPWQKTIMSDANPKASDIFVVIYPSNRGGYNIQPVPKGYIGNKEYRVSIPESWKGLNGEALQSITGVADATFWHTAGFIGAANSLEGAKALAKLLLS